MYIFGLLCVTTVYYFGSIRHLYVIIYSPRGPSSLFTVFVLYTAHCASYHPFVMHAVQLHLVSSTELVVAACVLCLPVIIIFASSTTKLLQLHHASTPGVHELLCAVSQHLYAPVHTHTHARTHTHTHAQHTRTHACTHIYTQQHLHGERGGNVQKTK